MPKKDKDGKWRLRRPKQCAKCPWKVKTDPNTIPGQYCSTKHSNLDKTMAPSDWYRSLTHNRAMACHESKPGDEDYCVGWLVQQLGVGNNIRMRLEMTQCLNRDEIEVFGEQHERFEDTLPENKRVRA